jgi:hypothetical protein
MKLLVSKSTVPVILEIHSRLEVHAKTVQFGQGWVNEIPRRHCKVKSCVDGLLDDGACRWFRDR